MKQIIRGLLSVLLLLSLLPGLAVRTNAAENQTVRLQQTDTGGGNVPFRVENMFPGDAVSREFVIRVNHENPVEVHYHADIRPGYEILSEILEINIALPDKNLTLYDGLLRDMPASVSHILPSGEDSLRYRMTVSLPKEAGNRYQAQALIADFRWWYLEETPEDPVFVKLTAEKTMNGQYARGDGFTFELRDSTGVLVQKVNNDDGIVEFDSLAFRAPGIYRYTIRELPGSDAKIRYDDAVYQAIVEIREDRTASVVYTRNGENYTAIPRFVNRHLDNDSPDKPEDVDPSNPKTGDRFPLTALSCVAGISLLRLLLLLLLRRKEDPHGA